MIFGVFGDGKNYEYADIEEELSRLVLGGATNPDTIVVGGRSGLDVFIHRFGREHGCCVLTIYPFTQHKMPNRDMEMDMLTLFKSQAIITFNTKGQENTKTIEKKAIEKGMHVTLITKDKKGIVWAKDR